MMNGVVMCDLAFVKNQYADICFAQVVAFDNAYCIGKNNALAWHIPEDLQHFKKITNNGVVVMGKNTFLSMGKALPNRVNWVVTSDKDFTAPNIKVAHSLTQALVGACNDVKALGQDTLFIIGGAMVYERTLSICDKLYITQVDLTVVGDAFYPSDLSDFVRTNATSHTSKNGVSFCIAQYNRKTA